MSELKKELEKKDLLCPSIGPVQNPKGFWKWRLFVDGVPQDMDEIRHVAVSSPWGLLNIGAEVATGYNMVSIQEEGSGGSVVIPFVFVSAAGKVVDEFKSEETTDVFIGVVLQNRPKMGGEVVKTLPRGIRDPGENYKTAAMRELQEEAGIKFGELFQLGSLININPTFFETGKDGGVQVFGLQIKGEDCSIDSDGKLIIEREEDVEEMKKELITGFEFVSMWDLLRDSKDGINLASVARLLVWIKENFS